MFLGAAGGIALSHLPGLAMVPAAAMGIGAMTAAMLRLPMTAVLLTTLFLGSDGFPVMPLTIVAVVVAYLTANWLTPPPADRPQTSQEQPAAAGPMCPVRGPPPGRTHPVAMEQPAAASGTARSARCLRER